MFTWMHQNLLDSTPHVLVSAIGLALLAGLVWMLYQMGRTILRNVVSFNPKRIWAISGVSFQESIRRRVLWLTPLAIIGVVAVSQLQVAADDQDAIRQTTKYAIFASGVLVVMDLLILACTNLPKEIDTRVIYTVVTKPATRLEIIVGKIVGFSRVSAALLLIMGLFTWGYVFARAKVFQAAAEQRLRAMAPDDPSRFTVEQYAKHGLLHANDFQRVQGDESIEVCGPSAEADEFEDPQADPIRWIEGGGRQTLQIPFDIGPAVLPKVEPGEDPPDNGGLVIHRLRKRRLDGYTPFPQLRPPPETATRPSDFIRFADDRDRPNVSFAVLTEHQETIVSGQEIRGQEPGTKGAWAPVLGENDAINVLVPSAMVDRLRFCPDGPRGKRIYIAINGGRTKQPWCYGLGPGGVEIFSPRLDPKLEHPLAPAERWPLTRGERSVLGAQQLAGAGDPRRTPVGVFHFTRATGPSADASVLVEFRGLVTRYGPESKTERDDMTDISLQVHNRLTGKTYAPIRQELETGRFSYLRIGADELAGGELNVLVRCLSAGHYIGLKPDAVTLVRSEGSFAFNVFKSMAVLWLMSLLVIAASIFSSTFVSWPIAILLASTILVSRWGVNELADSLHPGLGRQIWKGLAGADSNPATAQVASEGIDALVSVLVQVSRVLPDMSRFAAMESIEYGVNVPPAVLLESLWVALPFGLALTALAYVIFKAKEVAP